MPGDFDDADDKVGYRHPPKRTRFRPGRSGNPKGRPKASNNLRTDVRKALRIPVTIDEGGSKRKVSTQEAMMLRLRADALKGVPKALGQMIALAGAFNDDADADRSAAPLSRDDRELIAASLERLSRARKRPRKKGEG